MGRVEAVIFASAQPVTRDALAKIVGKDCNLDELVDDIRSELKARPYELVAVAGGFAFRTKKHFAEAIRAAAGVREASELSKSEQLVLTAIAYFQPVTRRELSEIFGREVSRDVIGSLRATGLVASGPRSPRAGAPMTYVTTTRFLAQHGFESLRRSARDGPAARRRPAQQGQLAVGRDGRNSRRPPNARDARVGR
jgi:segregation and condensation protein B